MSAKPETPADSGDIPVIDVAAYFAGEEGTLEDAGAQLRHALENIGFYCLAGHGVKQDLVDRVFAATREFHALSEDAKLAIRQNEHNVGYMPLRTSVNRANAFDKVADNPNVVEALFLKRELPADHPDVIAGKPFRTTNLWPGGLPGFRETCLEYCATMAALCARMLPVYAMALDLPADFFDEAFSEPAYTLRLSHYPPVETYQESEFGIAPHTDTSFLTMLAQNEVPGLSVRRTDGAWIDAPAIPGAFIVNSGDLAKRWTNERFLSTPHRAFNSSGEDRYAIPFFFDCHVDHVLECLPSCHGPGNPPKYPPISYMDYMIDFTRANYDNVRAAAEQASD
ncbi:MAG: 2-oxoglutarate and iron-dependent oxygenase domain-containing protein [Alphaproteobacteria bacterium]|jgi:isopenicillin N synthase-like dioxygenase|nr:2-oxoglutarate and iron-dependent oxygenase domain-containing protein [Alphaproteobacteria bacterium]